jgi:uncharacterized beta-barrel protein YwiB (DUF1934 family)
MKNVLISIKNFQTAQYSDEESFELVTDGEYTIVNGIAEFSYLESALTGSDYAGMKTSFVVEPAHVVLTRAGGLIGEMIFTEGRKHHFVYETNYGSLTMGIDTQSITQALNEDGGDLEIHYAIDVDNIVMSRNSLKINVKDTFANINMNLAAKENYDIRYSDVKIAASPFSEQNIDFRN